MLIIDCWIFYQNSFLTIFDPHMDDYLKQIKYFKICYNIPDRFCFFHSDPLLIFSFPFFADVPLLSRVITITIFLSKYHNLAFPALLPSQIRKCNTIGHQWYPNYIKYIETKNVSCNWYTVSSKCKYKKFSSRQVFGVEFYYSLWPGELGLLHLLCHPRVKAFLWSSKSHCSLSPAPCTVIIIQHWHQMAF